MKNIKYFVGAICLALSLNSCSDFLNEEPVSEIPAGDMWQTARDAKAGINEIYGLLRSLYARIIFIGVSSVRIM
mgnify:CR=1 FL=1